MSSDMAAMPTSDKIARDVSSLVHAVVISIRSAAAIGHIIARDRDAERGDMHASQTVVGPSTIANIMTVQRSSIAEKLAICRDAESSQPWNPTKYLPWFSAMGP